MFTALNVDILLPRMNSGNLGHIFTRCTESLGNTNRHLVTIDGNNGYNFELTEDFKKALKRAADDVEAYKQMNLRQKGPQAKAPAATHVGGAGQGAAGAAPAGCAAGEKRPARTPNWARRCMLQYTTSR